MGNARLLLSRTPQLNMLFSLCPAPKCYCTRDEQAPDDSVDQRGGQELTSQLVIRLIIGTACRSSFEEECIRRES